MYGTERMKDMAYNNFPIGYQPMQMPYQSMANNSNQMTWVQGEAGAKSYLLAPNTTVPLWDSESQTVYIKSADASGMPSMKVLDYTIRDSSQSRPAVVGSDTPTDFVTHKELTALENRIKKQISKLAKEESSDE